MSKHLSVKQKALIVRSGIPVVHGREDVKVVDPLSQGLIAFILLHRTKNILVAAGLAET